MNKTVVVTIGRQYGSGGREIGRKLAERLGVPFYDKELIAMAAKESGIREEVLQQLDERATNSFLYSLVMGVGNMGTRVTGATDLPMNDKLFLVQVDLIKKIAEKGSCVIVGRCADYALRDYDGLVSVFIHSDMKNRIKRAVEEYGEDPQHVESAIRKTDKRRADYYNYYSDGKWGGADNYDLCISSDIGIDNCVDMIQKLVELK